MSKSRIPVAEKITQYSLYRERSLLVVNPPHKTPGVSPGYMRRSSILGFGIMKAVYVRDEQ
jgi:hypothetical protein